MYSIGGTGSKRFLLRHLRLVTMPHMAPAERHALWDRWQQIARELNELSNGKVLPGDVCPAKYEGELLEEQDEIEYALGEGYFEGKIEL